jgi:eukaryotic-like serine/threonine-protein kinase
MIWHQVRQPKPVTKIRNDIPAELIRILEKMLAKEPGRRFQTPQELIVALGKFAPTAVPPPTFEEMPPLAGAAWGQAGSTATNNPGTPVPLTKGSVLVRPAVKPGAAAVSVKPKPGETLRDISMGGDTKINSAPAYIKKSDR